MIKTMFDFTLSLIGFVFLFPIFFLLTIILFFVIGTPIFFIQKRPGVNGIPFNFYKFRTMSDDKDINDILLPDEERLTTYGKILRETSLDELPSLWNVVKGEMSMVGPRPLLMEYLPLYSEKQMRRFKMKPGITGWAQINGRNSISWEERFELDVWYVDNQSLWLDIKIIVLTIWKVFTREGVSPKEQLIMKKFTGK